MCYKVKVEDLNSGLVIDELRRNNKVSSDEIFKAVSTYCYSHLLFPGKEVSVFKLQCNEAYSLVELTGLRKKL